MYDDETDITISGDGYFDATLHRDGFGRNGNVGTIPLNLISGFSIAANINLQKAVGTGEAEEVTAWNDGLNNLEFSLTNATKNKDITDFTVQNGNVIIKSGANVGDDVRLIAKSKQGIFAESETTFTIEEGTNAFDLLLTERGGLDAVCDLSNNGGTNGYLYDNEGVLVSMGSYTGENLSLRHLPKGVYTLISIGKSQLLGSMTKLSDLTSIGLTEGEDYVRTHVEVADGEITYAQVNEVPKLQETKFYYTTNNTYFNVNTPSITAGNYLILSAHLDFKPEYADKVNGVTLSIDLPDGCQIVENSAIANRQPVAHSVNGNHITFMLTPEEYQSQLRFCIIPSLNKNYTITAIASFDKDGKVQQPIGTAQFEAKGLSLSVPKYANNSNVTLSGTAKRHSDVSVYDNDVLIGKTTSKADGNWSMECKLFKPRIHSFHEIYAKIITEDGLELTSETKQVEYDKNGLVPETVTMLYNGYNIVYDLLQATTTSTNYSYAPSVNDFTFLADFTHNDTTRIKNVNIKVLNTDGTVRTLPAIYDGKQNHWVATTKYESSNRLPQNVAVEYRILEGDSIDNTDTYNDQMAILSNGLSAVMQFADNNYDYDIIEEEESVVSLKVKENEEAIYTTKIKMLEFKEAIKRMDEVQFDFDYNENGKLLCSYTEILDAFTSTVFIDFEDSVAFTITMQPDELVKHFSKSRRTPDIVNTVSWMAKIAGKLQFCGDIIDDFCPYLNIKSDLSFMYDLYKSYRWYLDDIHLGIQDLLYVRCSDGSFKLSDGERKTFMQELSIRKEQCDKFTDQLYDYITEYERRIAYSAAYDLALTLAGVKASSLLLKSIKFVPYSKIVNSLTRFLKKPYMKVMPGDNQKVVNMMGNVLDLYLGNLIDGIDKVVNPAFADFQGIHKTVSSWAPMQYNLLMNEYFALSNAIELNYKKCKKDDDEDDPSDDKPDFRGEGSTPLIDPSGYVYEAVLSNRLEGVTTTCYQQENGEAVVWNAEDYSQKNPLKTDEAGFYRWDVPQGMWQVKYEKEGYETTYSEWLPVPPPQLDVNVGMKQSTPPTVTQMRGFESGITIELSKYMLPATLNESNITVTRNGLDEKGHIELMNEEKEPLGEQTFASKVKFVPESLFSTSDQVVVTVHKEVESYCSVKMAKDHVETVKIESEIKSIMADSAITVPYQSEKELRILVLPIEASAGRALHVRSSSPMIASVSATEVTIDQDGSATLTIGGELPGGAFIDFSVKGTDLTATSKVQVTFDHDLVATPTASIQSGEIVESGTVLILSCATEGATIYYTLDGSCPCDETTRQRYDGPITIASDVVVKVIAVKEGMDDSDIATFVYMMNSINGVYADNNIRIDSKDQTIFVTGARGTSCQIYDLQGRIVAGRNRLTNQSRFKMKSAGIYLIQITLSNGQTIVNRALVK